jgi:hypothetical protein
MKIDNFNNSNFDNNQTNNNKLQTSDLSLKFNYDNYINGNQSQNLYQNDSMFNNYIQNINQNIEENKNNNINILNKPNFDEIKMNDNNIQRNNNFQNNNNLSYNKSIRDQYNIYNKNLNQDIMNDYSKQNILNINSEPRFNSKKDKLSIIADIIMKINSEDYYYEILTKLHGDDLTDKLMSSDVSNEFLESVLNSINEIERSKKREEEFENEPKIFPTMEQYKNHNRKNKNKKFNKKNNSFNEYNYKNNLNLKKTDSREYNEINFKKNGRKKINSGSRKEKPFINATCAYGNYFDPPLQKGGMSKLTSYKKK